MVRSIVLLVTGAMAGAAAAYLYVDANSGDGVRVPQAEPEPERAADISLPEPAGSAPDTAANVGGYASERLAVYEAAAAATDVFEIESMVQEAVAEPPSRSRDLELTALLARLAELDPRRAVEFAESRYLATRFLVPLFEAWARVDADAAIAMMARTTPPAKRREIAMAILDVVGNDEDGVERIAASLPEADRLSLEVDALAERAGRDPAAALQAVLDMDSPLLQSLALQGLAGAVTRLDPALAMAQASMIEDFAMRTAYTGAVVESWAELDPEAVLAWLETAEPAAIPNYSSVYQTLAASDPERLMAVLDRFPPLVRTNAQRAVVQALAATDAEAALAMLRSLPPGQDSDRMLQAIAETYGRQNPDAAMAWAKSLPPPQSGSALGSVLRGISSVDTDRALDLLFAALDGPGVSSTGLDSTNVSYLSLILSMVSSNGADAGRIADRLIGRNDAMTRTMMSNLMSTWAQADSQAALSWALAHADSLDPSVFRQVAAGTAQSNLDQALGTLNQLPPAQRAAWLEGLAGQLANSDVNRAVTLLDRFRGQPGYEAAYSAVVVRLAQSDPVAAARMLSESDVSSPAFASAVYQVSRQWATRDPAAAADWALHLDDVQARTRSLGNVASAWAQRDAGAARQWVLGMATGAARDAALDGYVSMMAQGGEFDPSLIDAYSSDQAAQRGASRAILMIGRTDPEVATRLLNTYITDDVVRRETEANLARTSGSGAGSVISSAGAIFF